MDNIIQKNINQDVNIDKVVLNNRLTNGKEVPWKLKKIKSLELCGSYGRLGFDNKMITVHQCGNFLEFKRFDNGEMKLSNASFCKARLCPMCSWRRGIKIFSQVSNVINTINEYKDYRFLFLTLTCKNVIGDDLKSQINILFKSFDKMFRRKELKNSIKGWFRALEVTHDVDRFITEDMYYGNPQKHLKSRKTYYDNLGLTIGDENPNFNMYHPHFHIILLVNNSYFNDSKIYISQKKWTSLWRESLQCDYTPIVHIQPFKKNNNKEVNEVAKYTVKDNDFLVKKDPELTDETVKILDIALAYRRLVAFGGLMKDIHKKLNLSDVDEDDNLINIDSNNVSEEVGYVLEVYRWVVGYSNYFKI